MSYYLKKTLLGANQSLMDVVAEMPLGLVALGETVVEQKKLWPAEKLRPPDEYFFPAGLVKSIELEVTGALGRPIEGNTLIEPSTFTQPVVYTNVVTGEALRFGLDQLPLGDKRVSVGGFYFIQHPLIYYYCDTIAGDQVRWHIVESFQCGEIITATFLQNVRYSQRYIPVRDQKIVRRLEKRLADYRAGVPGGGDALGVSGT